MANEYSVAIHNYISDKIAATEKKKTHAEFQDFLKENFNPKLPRRIRETYFGKKN